jgi:hypothetical protein
MTRALLLLVSCSACAGEPVRIKLYDDRGSDLRAKHELMPEIVEACDFWGFDCVAAPKDKSYGTLLISIEEDNSVECGREMATGVCRKSFKACLYATSIAHEMGHAFGLDDLYGDDDKGNLMWWFGAYHELDTLDATDDQHDEVIRHVSDFNACK